MTTLPITDDKAVPKSRLQHFREYMVAHPLQAWLFSVTVTFLCYLGFYLLYPSKQSKEISPLFIGLVLGQPTFMLLCRFSDKERQEKPIAPSQELGIGIISLLSVSCSMIAEGLFIFRSHLGLPEPLGMGMLTIFSVGLLLSLALGYIARHAWTGRLGMQIAVGWLLTVVSVAMFTLITQKV